MYIDTHAHFDLCIRDKDITEESLIRGLKENDIKYAVQISIDTDGFNWTYEFAKRYRDILFSIGIHPSSKVSDDEYIYFSEFVERIMKSEDKYLLFGIGETGLDYYRMYQPVEDQIYSFECQIEVAKRWQLPLIVHSRNAFAETLGILKEKQPESGVMHCFSGDSKEASKILDLGFYISFAGNLTYKKAYDIQETASYVPLDRMLLETDAPFLAPVPLRGKKNRPEHVRHIYQFLANLKKEDLSKVQDRIYENFTLLSNR